MILAPLGAMLVQMAISRTREYAADDLGARIAGQPMWLASALGQDRRRRASGAESGRRAQSGDRAHVHHQSAIGPWRRQSLRQPSLDREPHRGLAATCGRIRRAGCGRSPRCRERTIRRRSPWGGRRPRAGRGADAALVARTRRSDMRGRGDDHLEAEIVGNIYENPELLK